MSVWVHVGPFVKLFTPAMYKTNYYKVEKTQRYCDCFSLFVCLHVCVFVCLSTYPFVCLLSSHSSDLLHSLHERQQIGL